MNIKFVKTHSEAKLPEKNHSYFWTGDAGFDLFAVEDTVIPARGSAIVKVGLTVGYITPGYWFRIEPRSGLGFVKGLQPHMGIIDNGYRGDLAVKVYNLTDEIQTISKGKGCAQIIAYPMIPTNVSFIDEVTHGERGEKGFGSSDE
jgi:dUTP pyrophosphatase